MKMSGIKIYGLLSKQYVMDTFEKLDVMRKYEILRKEGTRILTISYQKFCVTLFLFNGVYMESYYNIDTLKVESINPAGFNDLSKYLDYITIYDLYWI
jgi:hypothetical protein